MSGWRAFPSPGKPDFAHPLLGNPAYAVPTLTELHRAGHTLVGVVSQPDRRRGRGQQLVPSAVKQQAQKLNLPVFTPDRIRRDSECQQQLAALKADLSVVVAFGQILPPEVLEQPPLGLEQSRILLPRWRGAAPIQWSILGGDKGGVGVMAMEEGLVHRGGAAGTEVVHRAAGQRPCPGVPQRMTADLMVEALPLIEAAGAGSTDERWKRLCLQPQGRRAVMPGC